MYTIKHAAQQVGVSVSTLRAWERRYGVGAAERTEAGYRIYDDAAVRALSLMNSLVLDGWSVRAAAEEVHRRRESAAPVADVDLTAGGVDHPLVQVAEALDATALTTVLDAGFTRASFEPVVDSWLLPGLREVGAAWASGRVSVAGEHLVAAGVARRLAAAYDAAGTAASGPRAILGLPPDARHELGLLAFATALRRQGIATTYLGCDVPLDDWATAIEAQSADCAVLAVPTDTDAASAAQAIAAVQARRPQALTAIGGSAQDLVSTPALRLGHEIGTAAQSLARRLERTSR